MGLSFAEKAISLTKKIDFPKVRYNNVQYFNLGNAHKQKFGLDLESPLFFPFSLATLRFVFFLAVVKRWVLIMGKA